MKQEAYRKKPLYGFGKRFLDILFSPILLGAAIGKFISAIAGFVLGGNIVCTTSEAENVYHIFDGLNANGHPYLSDNIQNMDTNRLLA